MYGLSIILKALKSYCLSTFPSLLSSMDRMASMDWASVTTTLMFRLRKRSLKNRVIYLTSRDPLRSESYLLKTESM